MNKLGRILIHVPVGIIKMTAAKVFHFSGFSGPIICAVSPLTEISIDGKGKLRIGSYFRMRDGAKIRVRRNAECKIGRNVSVNSNDIIACHESITIGDNVQLSPNVQIYDHDHDFRAEHGVSEMKYCTSPVTIGNDCWIGANTVILS